MTRIAALNQYGNERVHGYYRLMQAKQRLWDWPGQPSIRLLVGDASGTAHCVGAISPGAMTLCDLEPDLFVQVQGRATASADGGVLIHATRCTPIATEIADSWHLLPRAWAPVHARPAFDRMIGLLDRVGVDSLRAFASRVFASRAVAEPYLSVAGSCFHHHARPGGLLIHSVECAKAAEQLGTLFLSEHETALAVVGALLHDINKIRTMSMHSHAQYRVSQETLNLGILEPYLTELDAAWSAGAWALREMLAPAKISGTANRWAPLLMTDLIRYADRLSAGADLRQVRFRGLSRYKRCMRTENGQLLARVLPPGPVHHTTRGEARP